MAKHSHVRGKDTSDAERIYMEKTEKILRLFDGALAKHGIKEVDFLPSGFKFRYLGKDIEIKIIIK